MESKILLAHGSGGKLSHELIGKKIMKRLSNPMLDKMNDASVFEANGRLAFTTDSYVVNPIEFPGANIGKLAVCGTVNDLSMAGAKPLYLSLAYIIEEGLPLDTLDKITASVQEAAEEAGVKIVTGDTKVVGRGSADKIFINTSGIGVIPEGVDVSGANAKAGDKIILSGTIGDHGVAVMTQREGLNFKTPVESDCAPLNKMVASMISVTADIHVLRDPTRGGLATTLNEIAEQSEVNIVLEESEIPVRDAVRGACELLGLDPMYVANEGKLIAIVPSDKADEVLKAMQKSKYGQDAAIIGEVKEKSSKGMVTLKTAYGTTRIIDMLSGELLPRIC